MPCIIFATFCNKFVLVVKLFHFLRYNVLVESPSDCMTRWSRHLNNWFTGIKEHCVQCLSNAMLSLQSRGEFDIFAPIAYHQSFFLA